MRHFFETMVDVLTTNAAKAVGHVGDRFHYQQSGTTAGCIDKLRKCDAYMTIYCPDATRCLYLPAATGSVTDCQKNVDLEFFLDGAHGDEFDHSNKAMRDKLKK